MLTLQEATTPRGDELVVEDDWLQGRGAYGGLTVAALVRAIEARVADPRRKLRSLTAELPAPTIPGTARIEIDVLRSGNNLTVARAALRQHDEVTTHVVATLAASRDTGDAWAELAGPELPPWESVPVIPLAGPGPVFARHFEYRVAAGIPFTDSEPVSMGWVRPRAPGALRDAAFIAALIDAWWPAAMNRFRGPRPLATIAYTLEIVDGLEGLEPDAPLAYRGRVPVCRDGYFLETRELWGSDGRLVARNHQTFAIIR